MTTRPTPRLKPTPLSKPVEVTFTITNDHQGDPGQADELPTTIDIQRIFPNLIIYQQFLNLNLPADKTHDAWDNHAQHSYHAHFTLCVSCTKDAAAWVKLLAPMPTFVAQGVQ